MTKREVIQCVMAGERPPYVPWSFGFTAEASETLIKHFGPDYERALGNHLLGLGYSKEFFTQISPTVVRDIFGVEWDRSVDKDIGNVSNCVLASPTLDNYSFPNPRAEMFFTGIPDHIAAHSDMYRVFCIGFSLYERAWTMRGMQNLMMDFYDNPGFVRALLRTISDYNLAQVDEALKYDIDAVYFGDDLGQQIGLQMGKRTWFDFIYPELVRMYGAVQGAGKAVFIHSCGDVDELFDDLVGIGLSCFNPFQPEVMDVFGLLEQYRGRLAFHGGLSTQKTLPFGSADDVRTATRQLLAGGADGSYILSPAHAVEGDVPLANMLAFIEEAQCQIA